MGGLFGGGGSSQQAVAPPTPSLAPEATSVSRAEVSDGEAAVSRMYEKERKTPGLRKHDAQQHRFFRRFVRGFRQEAEAR